ncbi:MAG: GAF domain-containing protein [Pseudomonadota bacterium]
MLDSSLQPTRPYPRVPPPLVEDLAQDFAVLLEAVLEVDGPHQALRFLNSMTANRCSGLYRFDGGMLTNLQLVDSEDPAVTSAAAVPVDESYCVFVRASGRPFVVDDSLADPRVASHRKRQAIRSYCGVPLSDDEGNTRGTICHFDPEPNRTDSLDLVYLDTFAHMVQRPGVGTELRQALHM